MPIINNNNNNNSSEIMKISIYGIFFVRMFWGQVMVKKYMQKKIEPLISVIFEDFLNSEASASDQVLNSEGIVLNSEPTDSYQVLNSE